MIDFEGRCTHTLDNVTQHNMQTRAPQEEVEVGDDQVAHVAVVEEVGVELVDRLAQGQRGLVLLFCFGGGWVRCRHVWMYMIDRSINVHSKLFLYLAGHARVLEEEQPRQRHGVGQRQELRLFSLWWWLCWSVMSRCVLTCVAIL